MAALLVLLLTALQLYPLLSEQGARLMSATLQALLMAAMAVMLLVLVLLWMLDRRPAAGLASPIARASGAAAVDPHEEARHRPGAVRDTDRDTLDDAARPGRGQAWCDVLFQDTGDPTLILDPVHEIVVAANPAAAQLLVSDRDALSGAAMSRLCPDALAVLRGLVRRVLRDGSAWAGELCCRNGMGEELRLEAKATAVRRAGRDVVLAMLSPTEDLQDGRARVEALAYHDALTGLPNRVLLRDRLEMALARSQRSGTRGAVLVIDADNFKTVNDSLGHSAGDVLLQELTGRILKVLHEDDTLARLGGDEFVVLPQQVSGDTALVLEHALAVVDRIRSVLDRPFMLDGHDIHLTLSVGVAVYPNDGNTVDELLRRADSAMYQAKASGRNALHFYSPELEERMAQRLTMGSALRRALANEEFVLEFQPKLVLADRRLTGCEALVRWDRPGVGRVPPLEFLPYMEEMGLMGELGFWVLDRACQYWRDGRDQGIVDEHFQMAVNISAGQFANPAFVQMVRSVLEENGMPGGNLELEITEQALVSDLANAAGKITALQALGVSFAIDDFGTGYSSLAYLQQLPVDCLKIDRGFVKLIGQSGRGAGLVDVIIGIARKLNLRVVAEGVEFDGQAVYLTQHGCDVGQGYLFGKPVGWERLRGNALESGLVAG